MAQVLAQVGEKDIWASFSVTLSKRVEFGAKSAGEMSTGREEDAEQPSSADLEFDAYMHLTYPKLSQGSLLSDRVFL